QAQRQQREGQHRGGGDRDRITAARGQQGPPPPVQRLGNGGDVLRRRGHHDRVEQQKRRDHRDRDEDRLGEPGEEHRAEHGQQRQRDEQPLVAQRFGGQRVGHDVGGGVGSRQRDRDDPGRRDE